MNRTQLTDAVASSLQVSKAQAANCINAVLGAIADNLTEGDQEVAIPDFGRFFVKSVAARQYVNPTNKEKIMVEAHDKLVFKPSDNMGYYSRKHAVNK
jgi:DNA-binding protein HU-beta/DNA-binding protein HU-alpha